MAFISIIEHMMFEQKEELDALNQRHQDLDRQLLTKDQQLRKIQLRGIGLCLKLKFQSAGEALFAEVQEQTDVDWLRRFLDSIESAASVEDLGKRLP